MLVEFGAGTVGLDGLVPLLGQVAESVGLVAAAELGAVCGVVGAGDLGSGPFYAAGIEADDVEGPPLCVDGSPALQ